MHNAELVKRIKPDEHAHALLKLTQEDAKLGRMSSPCVLSGDCLSDRFFSPRMAVVKARPDGKLKIRAVDHMSWGVPNETDRKAKSMKSNKAESVNGHTYPGEKLKFESLDDLAAAMKYIVAATHQIPGLMKSDIDAAFRRIPIASKHRWLCAVIFAVDDKVFDYECPLSLT